MIQSRSIREIRKPILRTYRDLESPGFTSNMLPSIINDRLLFHDGNIDGGDLGGLSEAMDHLDGILDGGWL